MVSRIGFAAPSVALACLAAAGVGSAEAATLPGTGHYIGRGTVASVSSACSDALGSSYGEQLDLSTPEQLVVLTQRIVAGTAGPDIVKTKFKKNSGSRLNPSGKATVTDVGAGTVLEGTYTALYKPLDAGSFSAMVTVVFPTASGTCTETSELVYLRSGVS